MQEHKFPCPGCGVEISFVLDIDQKNIRYKFRKPKNGRWVKIENGSIQTLTFDAERVVPQDMSKTFSPFIAEMIHFDYQSNMAYAKEESLRRAWPDDLWPWIERLIVHFDNGNDVLFDKEAKLNSSAKAKTRTERLTLLYRVVEGAFDLFTVDKPSDRARVRQRIALAQSISNELFTQLVQEYVTSTRLLKLWREINNIRASCLKHYLALAPLLRVRYWRKPLQDFSGFELSEKKFDDLRQFYVDCFETLCRLMVLAVGIESIIHHQSLMIPIKKSHMSLWDFEKMANGRKPDILKDYPIQDLFIPLIDHKLRNGIGHHSAHYSRETDEIIYHETKGAKVVERRISYTQFCDKVLKIFSGVELAALYFQVLHLRSQSLS